MTTILIDSGGTSSDWAILDQSEKAKVFTTEGMNPVSADIQSIVDQAISNHSIANIDKIYMYGAGCSTEKLKQVVRNGLSKIADPKHIQVESDLLGAAYALCGRRPGIISILGTGSNTAVFNGQTFSKSIDSGGYLLGDEGSGYMIGKELIMRYLRGGFGDFEMKILRDHIQLDNAELINKVYSAERPNHLIASYAVGLKKLNSDSQESIILPIFKDFIDKRLLPYGKNLQLGLFFCGSVAFHYQKELTLALNSVNLQLVKVIPKPIEALVKFHNEYL